MCSYHSHAPYWGPGLQPRHVPWLGIEPATPWFAGWSFIHWATPARRTDPFLKGYQKVTIFYSKELLAKNNVWKWYLAFVILPNFVLLPSSSFLNNQNASFSHFAPNVAGHPNGLYLPKCSMYQINDISSLNQNLPFFRDIHFHQVEGKLTWLIHIYREKNPICLYVFATTDVKY